jgi:hypothetical protein
MKGPTALVQRDFKIGNLDETEVEPIRNLVNVERDLVKSSIIPVAGDNIVMRSSYRIESCETSPECSDEGLEGLEGIFIFIYQYVCGYVSTYRYV